MARQTLDHTGNEDLGQTIAKINAMTNEVYASGAGGGASAALVGASLAVTGNMGGATASSTGLATLGSAKLDTGTKTATASAGAATLSKNAGVVTTESLTTAGLAAYTLTLTNTTIAAADQMFVSVQNGTNTQGTVAVGLVTPGAGSATIVIRNLHATEALNGTLKIAFAVLKN